MPFSSEQGPHPEQRPPEYDIVPDEKLQAAWATHTTLPTGDVDGAWDIVRRLGLVGAPEDGGENGMGWGIPARFNRFVPATLQTPDSTAGTRHLEHGTAVRDVFPDTQAVVQEIDDEKRTVLWVSDWSERQSKKPGRSQPFYTYRITLTPGEESQTTVVTTEIRATNVGTFVRMLGPVLDQQAMKLFAQGLTEKVDPAQAEIARQKQHAKNIGCAAAIVAGVAGVGIVRRLTKANTSS